MGHVKDRRPQIMMQALDLGSHFDPQLGIQIGKRLIQQKDFGIGYDGSGDGDTLLLSAGQFRRIPLRIFRDPHPFKRVHHFGPDLILGPFFYHKAKGHVVKDRHMRPQRVRLKHQIHAALAGLLKVVFLGIDDVLPIQIDISALGIFKACHNAQSGGLAASGRPQQCKEISIFRYKVDILKDMVLAIILIDMLQFYFAHYQHLLHDTFSHRHYMLFVRSVLKILLENQYTKNTIRNIRTAEASASCS